MNQLKCSIEGCDSVFEVSGPVSPDATFHCRHHDEFVGRGHHRRRSLPQGAVSQADGFADEPEFETAEAA
jgi:hypothetical protein